MKESYLKMMWCVGVLFFLFLWLPSCQSGTCERDSECPDGQFCDNKMCGWECKQDRDCTSGQLCTSRGKCQGQSNSEVGPSERSVPPQERSVPPQERPVPDASPGEQPGSDSPTTCTPNQSRCDGNTLKTCNAAGTSESFTPCPNGCENNQCKTQGCQNDCSPPWSKTCSNTNGYTVCVQNPQTGCFEKSKFIGCQEGNQCQAGACQGGCNRPEVMVVLDRSSSMQGTRWTYTTAALKTFLQVYDRGGVKFGMRLFPNNQCDAGGIQPIKENNASALLGQLSAPTTSSSTPINKALTGLDGAFGDPSDGELVILLTDGSETCDKPEDAIKAVQALRSRGIAVHVVAVGSGADITALDGLAAAGGTEKAKEAKDEQQLLSVLEGILSPLNLCCQKGIDYCGGVCCQSGETCHGGKVCCQNGLAYCGGACCQVGQTCYKGKCCTPNCNRDGRKRECGTNNNGCGGSCGTCPQHARCLAEVCHRWMECVNTKEINCTSFCAQKGMKCGTSCSSTLSSSHVVFTSSENCNNFVNFRVPNGSDCDSIGTPGWARCCCKPKDP